jgi:hypothetical protein
LCSFNEVAVLLACIAKTPKPEIYFQDHLSRRSKPMSELKERKDLYTERRIAMELLKIPEPRAEENSESKGLCRF